MSSTRPLAVPQGWASGSFANSLGFFPQLVWANSPRHKPAGWCLEQGDTFLAACSYLLVFPKSVTPPCLHQVRPMVGRRSSSPDWMGPSPSPVKLVPGKASQQTWGRRESSEPGHFLRRPALYLAPTSSRKPSGFLRTIRGVPTAVWPNPTKAPCSRCGLCSLRFLGHWSSLRFPHSFPHPCTPPCGT